MEKKKRKVKKSRIVIVFIVVIISVFAILFLLKKFKKAPAVHIDVIDTIDNFDYQLNDNETKYYNELFSSLKDLLKNENYEEEEYALLVGKLFLADFYDLNSKVMKSDVGGVQFVYSDYRSDFEKGAIDTVYKSVESNVYGDRKQKLPIVKSVDKVDFSHDSFEYYDNIDYDACYVSLSINYEDDLGYPSEVLLVLIHNNDKLEIAKMVTK